MGRATAGLAILSAMGLAAAHAAAAPKAGTSPASTEWTYYGGNIAFNRYSPLDLINPQNARGLKILWERPAIDAKLTERYPDLTAGNYFRPTPIEINGVLYAPDGAGLVEAFDAETGKTIWVQEPVSEKVSDLTGDSTRGVAYWRNGAQARIISIRGEYLYCLDAATGKRAPGFGDH